MRYAKMFGLVALAAVAAMAFVGASSAMATDTALCKVHQEPCLEANQLSEIHMGLTPKTVGQLLSNLATVLCLEVLGLGKTDKGTLGNPLHLQATLAFANCGSNATHDNCTVTVLDQPAVNLLKTGLDTGTLSADPADPGLINIQCTFPLGIKVNCDYEGNELSFGVTGATGDGHGMITATKTPAKFSKKLGGLLCPENSTLDGLLEPLEDVYIVS